MTGRIHRRPAVRQDLVDFFGKLPEATVRAQVWEYDGEVKAVAGYWTMSDGVAVVFSDIAEDVQVPPITIARQAVAYLSELDRSALCTAIDERAEAFLQRLGWEHAGTSEEGEVYAWQH